MNIRVALWVVVALFIISCFAVPGSSQLTCSGGGCPWPPGSTATGSGSSQVFTVTGYSGAVTGLRAPNGTQAVKGLNFLKGDGSIDATFGFHVSAANQGNLIYGTSNVNRVTLSNGTNLGVTVSSVGVYAWTSTTDSDATADTGLSRTAPGVIAVGTGAQGSAAGTLNAAAYQIGGVAIATATICSNTAASTTITGTSSKTYFNLNCSIPANSLTAGKTIKLEGRGVYNGNVTDTLIVTEELCQVSGCGSGVVTQIGTSSALTLTAVSNQYWEISMNSNVFTAGASGTVDTQGKAGFETGATTMLFDAIPNTTTQTIDTTAGQFLSISVKFSTNSGSDAITLRNFKVIIQ